VVNLLWAGHVVHHSSEEYNLSVALRQSSLHGLFTWVFYLPLALLGVPAEMFIACYALNLVYQFWIHTEIIGRMPRWFEAVMNTPSHHRVHHAINPRYLDRNYAGVFIVWDRLFGTFEAEREDDRPRYGVVRQLGSFNILWAALHEWVGIVRDLLNAPGWRNKLSYALREPGWSHDGSRETTEVIRARWRGSQAATTAPAESKRPLDGPVTPA
jgi:sterol desaturase/sphingolipid hydroxylase (fatty acid hydroxylase superfamily)